MSPTAATGAAVVLACVSMVLLVPAPVRVPGRSTRVRRELPRALVLLAVLTSALVLWSWLSIHRFVLVALVGCVVLGVGRLVGRRRAARAADWRCDQVLVVCDAVASASEVDHHVHRGVQLAVRRLPGEAGSHGEPFHPARHVSR